MELLYSIFIQKKPKKADNSSDFFQGTSKVHCRVQNLILSALVLLAASSIERQCAKFWDAYKCIAIMQTEIWIIHPPVWVLQNITVQIDIQLLFSESSTESGILHKCEFCNPTVKSRFKVSLMICHIYI
jgi:hypothetical protein